MSRFVIHAAVAAFVLFTIVSSALPANAQALDPSMVDGLTEAINNRDTDAVLAYFAAGATVTFDNSAFKVPDDTISVAEYAARQRPNNPDVPADIRMEIAPGSVSIGAANARWTWRQTAGFLRAMGIDYLEYTVTATTEAGKFKSLTIAPTPETVSRVPYSPPTMGGGPLPGMPGTGGNPLEDQLLPVCLALAAFGLVLTGAHLARVHSASR